MKYQLMIFPNYSKKKRTENEAFGFLFLRVRVIVYLLSERSEDNIILFYYNSVYFESVLKFKKVAIHLFEVI